LTIIDLETGLDECQNKVEIKGYRRTNRRRWCLAIHRQTDYILMSTSPRVRMLQVGVDHLSAQGSSIGRKGSQLYSKGQLILLCII
jgi:hypothetical protein